MRYLLLRPAEQQLVMQRTALVLRKQHSRGDIKKNCCYGVLT